MYWPSLHQQHQEPPKQQFQLALRYAQPGLAQPNLPPLPPGFMYMPAQSFLQGSVQGTVHNPVPSELALHHYNIFKHLCLQSLHFMQIQMDLRDRSLLLHLRWHFLWSIQEDILDLGRARLCLALHHPTLPR